MWVEKYRPSKLEDLVDQETIKQRLGQLLEKKAQLPHLLFAGPPGSGKPTTAMIIAQQILGEHWKDYTLSLNASDERGIDVVRERVKTFARFSDRREGIPYRLVILDESDEMCLHPNTRVVTGALDDLREESLSQLLAIHGQEDFELPSYNPKTRRLENDRGKIVPSGRARLSKIIFEDGREILASANHPFFVISQTGLTILRTQDLIPGVELADFGNRVLRCYNCAMVFYRQYPGELYERYFCSIGCRNVFFGSLSTNRSERERMAISNVAHEALKRAGALQTSEYRRKRSEIARRLIAEGRIPDPRTWKKFGKGEGAFLGRKLTPRHRKNIAAGDRKFFSEHPEVRQRLSEMLRKSLAREDGAYWKLVRAGFFKEVSMKANLASISHWKKVGFRSKTELRMAELLERWRIPYERERLTLFNDEGHHYPFAIDFVIGKRTALFVNGCWWHVCPSCKVEALYPKQVRNMEKDQRHVEELQKLGYKVIVVWEHELRDEETIQKEVLPKVWETVGISGGGVARIKHSRVLSVENLGEAEALNISVENNHNFLLANGILTHNTSDGQTALRRIMEENSTQTRFILICNYSTGIIEPLQSRCVIFRFQRLDEASVTEHLKSLAKREKLKVGSDGVFGAVYEATQGDLRQAINLLQAASASGEITVDTVKSVSGATVKARVAEVVKLALDGNFEAARTKMVELTRVYGIPERDFLRFANETLTSMRFDDLGKAIAILAEYDYRLVQGSQPELQLTAMLAQLSSLKRKGD
jgi:replication factor C small subunit